MEEAKNTKLINESSNEMKQNFLSNAISDITTYIQFTDTKVSIIMGSVVALVVGFLACYDLISKVLKDIMPCSWLGICICIFTLINFFSLIAVFAFGILTIRGHKSDIGYKSKWFLSQSVNEYSFDIFKEDLKIMTDEDIIENMAAELFKLNDINRQKAKTMNRTIHAFSLLISTTVIIMILLLINTL